jgi:chitosanase
MNLQQKEACRAVVNVFETGRIRGDYSAITVIKGDKGHLSYGRSQVSLGSGNLFNLLDLYCGQPGARFAADLQPQLHRFKDIDVTLDTDDKVKALLVQAGEKDPVMRAAQDQYFNQAFLGPACNDAEAFGVTTSLGQTVVYDSHIQGGWGILSARIGKVGARGEKDWVAQYVQMRRDWLSTRQPPVPATVYRMDSFKALIQDGNFDLTLPFIVHGVRITVEALAGGETPAPGDTARTLHLTIPYLRGDDVEALQRALAANKGFENDADRVYGPFTDALVTKWQILKDIKEDGVGPDTRKSLGLGQPSLSAKVAQQG